MAIERVHGWWQGCSALNLEGYPSHGAGSANFNRLISDAHSDPVSGSAPHRAYRCEVSRLDPPSEVTS